MKREILKFLREQYPTGSRIRLREMKDLYSPVEPGMTGTLAHIDDMGTFHVNWDNGRTLGLVLGEDSFTVLPPPVQMLKLYMPMTVTSYERDDWGTVMDEEVQLSQKEAVACAGVIMEALQNDRLPKEATRGLMTYYNRNDSVDQKVLSYMFSAEVRDGKLWGVAECLVQGELTPEELSLLKEDITGQASDGFGEGFEQRELHWNDREIYAHLWSSEEDWLLQTERELFESMDISTHAL